MKKYDKRISAINIAAAILFLAVYSLCRIVLVPETYHTYVFLAFLIIALVIYRVYFVKWKRQYKRLHKKDKDEPMRTKYEPDQPLMNAWSLSCRVWLIAALLCYFLEETVKSYYSMIG